METSVASVTCSMTDTEVGGGGEGGVNNNLFPFLSFWKQKRLGLGSGSLAVVCSGRSRPSRGSVPLLTDVSHLVIIVTPKVGWRCCCPDHPLEKLFYWKLLVTPQCLSLQIQLRLSIFLHKEKKTKNKSSTFLTSIVHVNLFLFVAFKWPDCCPLSACRVSSNNSFRRKLRPQALGIFSLSLQDPAKLQCSMPPSQSVS